MALDIRATTHLDRDAIRELYLAAFPATENQSVATLALNLLSEQTNPESISLIAEMDSTVVGHVAFSPLTAAKSPAWLGYILAPLGVQPAYHKRGIGTKLVQNGIARLAQAEVDTLFVYGDPEYYARFGFQLTTAAAFLPPYELQYPQGWQAVDLRNTGFDTQALQLSCVPALRDPALW